ncbi:uncharacterized protein LOC122078344 [Macadamia integrifolia]|uniref:uncharacterized protein LOC122078344 n=1 Tax=Macadamia integrifolia TaxID=60698 RepID=UPI001C4F5B51|nr:uncharacterized protein LOC122078344 [Macadamia integrifolia]
MHPYMNPLIEAIVSAKTGMETPQMPDQQGRQQPLISPEAVSNSAWHNSGSVGPFFAVISIITVLAVISCILGRVCGGREVHPLENIRHRGCLGWLRRCRRCMGGGVVEVGARVVGCGGNSNGKAQIAEPSLPPPA